MTVTGLDDRSRYVLGWTNTAKIAALEAKSRKLEVRLGELGNLIGKIQAEQNTLRERLTALSKLDEHADFCELDWKPLAVEVALLTDEKQKLESASDVLKQLTERLGSVMAELKDTESKLEEHKDKRSKAEQKKNDARDSAYANAGTTG